LAGNEIVRAGCWSHARRKTIEAEKTAPEIAREAVDIVRVLYAVEREARDLSVAERRQLRLAQSAPELARLREKLLLWKGQLLPKHLMAEAVNYALGNGKS
jgi:transposase